MSYSLKLVLIHNNRHAWISLPNCKGYESTNIPSRWLTFEVTRPLFHCLQKN